MAGCWSPSVLLLLSCLWRTDLLLQLQLCTVSKSFSKQEAYIILIILLNSRVLTVFFSNNCEQDAVIISIINGLTSVYSAIVIYSIIGFRAMEKFDDCLNGYVMISFPGINLNLVLKLQLLVGSLLNI